MMKQSSKRCATAFYDHLMREWKVESNPYDDPAYLVPTCLREKIMPNHQTKNIRCATFAIDSIIKMEKESKESEKTMNMLMFRQPSDDS